MFNVFSTALSALNATSTAIDVVGNNLANMNTTGFKGSNMAFQDLISESLGGSGQTQVGFGTSQPLAIQDFSQGAIETSTGGLDAAIQGQGFFVISNGQGNTMYTRDGTFQVDNAGNLRTANGASVQGWTAVDAAGNIDTTGPIGNISLSTGALQAPTATTGMTANLNLDSSAAADATSAFSTPVTVYDSLGTSHVLTVNFQKTAANTWSYQVTIPGGDVTAGTAGTPFDISGASGSLTFDSSGQLTTPAPGSPIAVAIPGLADGAADMNITWDPYDNGAGRHHAIWTGIGLIGQHPERIARRGTGERQPRQRRHNRGPVFRWRPDHGGPTRVGGHRQPEHSRHGRKQRLHVKRSNGRPHGRNSGNGRPRNGGWRRAGIVQRGSGDTVH